MVEVILPSHYFWVTFNYFCSEFYFLSSFGWMIWSSVNVIKTITRNYFRNKMLRKCISRQIVSHSMFVFISEVPFPFYGFSLSILKHNSRNENASSSSKILYFFLWVRFWICCSIILKIRFDMLVFYGTLYFETVFVIHWKKKIISFEITEVSFGLVPSLSKVINLSLSKCRMTHLKIERY